MSESANSKASRLQLDTKTPAFMENNRRQQFLQERIQSLPKAVQNRIVALKNMQLEEYEMEQKYCKDLVVLEKKYLDKFLVMNEKRAAIVNGVVEPPEQKPKWKELPSNADVNQKKEFETDLSKLEKMPTDTKGIPDFWLNILKSIRALAQLIYEYDEPALRALENIQSRYESDFAFVIEFHFGENPFFTNRILAKHFYLKIEVDEDDPFSFDPAEIYMVKGCQIDWKPDMDFTVETIKKELKNNKTKTTRTKIKTTKRCSFFDFFQYGDHSKYMNSYHQLELKMDIQTGQCLRGMLIPRAVLYYTGDLLDDEEADEFPYRYRATAGTGDVSVDVGNDDVSEAVEGLEKVKLSDAGVEGNADTGKAVEVTGDNAAQ